MKCWKGSFGSSLVVVILTTVLGISRSAATAGATTLSFDDLPDRYVLTGSGYAGLNWEYGNTGFEGGQGRWVAGGDVAQSTPQSIVNAAGATLIGIGFPSSVNLSGAYFSLQGTVGGTQVRASGFVDTQLISTTEWTPILTSSPVWLDMSSLMGINRVILESIPVITSAGPYSLDDLTFTYIPEPASLAMLTLGGAGLLGRRRRRK